jgi:hypothetical protein
MISLQDNFGITFGEETITFGLELCAQFAEIINATVENDSETDFAIHHRLLGGGGKIEDT